MYEVWNFRTKLLVGIRKTREAASRLAQSKDAAYGAVTCTVKFVEVAK